MTEPAAPPPAAADEEVEVEEVEIDAMDLWEWEQDQRTPQASDANLAALVRESAKSIEPIALAPPRKTPLVPRGRVTGLVSPQPPRPVETPVSSGAPAETPAPLIEQVTPFAPTPAMGTPIAKPEITEPPALAEARLALDDVGHRAPSPMPVAASGTPMALPWPSPFAPSHGPYPLAVGDQAAPPGPGRRRGHRARHTTLETRGLLAVAASRRKVLWIGGVTGAVALVAVLVLVGGGKPGAVANSARIEDHAESPEDHAESPEAPVREAVAAPDVPASPPAPTTAAPDTPAVRPPPASSAPANRPGPRPAKQLGGKKLVVEYIERESEVPAPGLVAKAAEDPAIGRARSAYLSGNQKLFTGDAESAIRAYRQALTLYPGYVGGYRGLGLAYAQLGDTPKALDAFKTYVTAVPNAKDIALIRKRIARLQGR